MKDETYFQYFIISVVFVVILALVAWFAYEQGKDVGFEEGVKAGASWAIVEYYKNLMAIFSNTPWEDLVKSVPLPK